LFEKIKFLKGLQSVNSEVKITVSGHTEGVSGILDLDIVEDHGGDVVGVLLGESFIRGRFNLSNKFISIIQNGASGFGDEFFGMLVSGSLRERNTEGKIFVNLFEISSDGVEESLLWVFLNFSGISSGSLVGFNIGISDGIGSNIRESSDILSIRHVSVVSKTVKLGSFGRSEEHSNSRKCQDLFSGSGLGLGCCSCASPPSGFALPPSGFTLSPSGLA
jgi:hypothetical protein